VVLYNGRPRWKASVEVSDLIEHVSDSLERYRPRFSFLLLDEGQYRDEELKPLKNLVSALFRLENSRKPEQLMEVVTSLLEWLSAPEQASLRRAFTVWFNKGLFPSRMGKEVIPEFQELTEVRTMLAETVAEWKEEWKREALAEGLEQGLTQGREEGRAEILLKLLGMKFGPLSEENESWIRSADSDTLLKWSERVLSATTLDDIFRP